MNILHSHQCLGHRISTHSLPMAVLALGICAAAAHAADSTAPPAVRATLDFLWIRVPEGHLLWGVLPDGAAAHAGLRNGDIVTQIDDTPPKTTLTNDNAGPLGVLKDHRPGRRVVVDYLRDGQPLTTIVVLVPYPEDHGLARLTSIAEKGDVWAIHGVGVVHYMNAKMKMGADSEREYSEALPWFLKASAADFAWSHLLLGHMYAGGHGVKQQDETAIAYYEKTRRAVHDRCDRLAANIADVRLGAQLLKASLPDDQRALTFFREAAEYDSADGQLFLGWMYEKGRGVAPNRDEAVRWYKKSAAQGNSDAFKRLQNLGVSP